MPALELTEAVAWGLIFAGFAYAALQRWGVPTATVAAALAALATKSALLG
ncbi:hypothetical protein [Roseicella aquatilis]|nr:hypothetical protein [Roseicella aquatilis]